MGYAKITQANILAHVGGVVKWVNNNGRILWFFKIVVVVSVPAVYNPGLSW